MAPAENNAKISRGVTSQIWIIYRENKGTTTSAVKSHSWLQTNWFHWELT